MTGGETGSTALATVAPLSLQERFISSLRARPFMATGAMVLAACLVMMGTIDHAVARWVHEDSPAPVKAFFNHITDYGLAGHFYIGGALLYLAARVLYLQALPHSLARAYWQVSRMALYFLTTLAVSGLIVTLMKPTIGRLRPKHLLRDGEAGFVPGFPDLSNTSFPSGHSQVVVAVAASLTLLFPRLWFVFLPLGALGALSRVMVSAHFPSDIVFGAFIGGVTAVIVRRRMFADMPSAHDLMTPLGERVPERHER